MHNISQGSITCRCCSCRRVRLLRAALEAADHSTANKASSSSKALQAQLQESQAAVKSSQEAAAQSARREAELLDELQRLKLENLALASSRDRLGWQQQGRSRGNDFSEIEPFEVESSSSSMSSRACGDISRMALKKGPAGVVREPIWSLHLRMLCSSFD